MIMLSVADEVNWATSGRSSIADGRHNIIRGNLNCGRGINIIRRRLNCGRGTNIIRRKLT